uniref:Cytochrome P450 n=1 Tax=Oryza meridionalis TaxID=40149 RepID=A0A0E0EGV9_9ORYZ
MLLHLGSVPTLVVSSSRVTQSILRTHDDIFASQPYSAIANILFYGATDVGFSPYSEYWRQIKKITTTHLLTMKKVRSFGSVRQQEVRLIMARITEAASKHVVVDLTELLSCYSNSMVCHTVCGKLSQKEDWNQLLRELVKVSTSLLGGFHIEDYFPSITRLAVEVATVVRQSTHNINRRWDRLLEKLIDDHTTKQIISSSVLDHYDEEAGFIGVLLSMQHEYGLTRDNIKANLVAMLMAGTDTSFIELEYAMAELMQKPHVMGKLKAEMRRVMPKGQDIVTEEQLGCMLYLKAVIKETLRLHPEAPLLMPHLSMSDCNVNGYTIPSGTHVIVKVWALAKDSNYWENADEFMPERFIGNTSGDYSGKDFHFLPFGSGRRICPDQAAKGGIDMTETFGVAVRPTPAC